MNIVEVIALNNQMQAEGVIERYAIGGARHQLTSAWQTFRRQFLTDTP